MPVFNLIIILIIIGVLLWLVNNYIPMDPKLKQILNIVVVILVIFGLLQVFGVFPALSDWRVPRVNQ